MIKRRIRQLFNLLNRAHEALASYLACDRSIVESHAAIFALTLMPCYVTY